MIYYFPLEHIENRYTTHMDRDMCYYFDNNNIDYLRIYPDVLSNTIKDKQFFLNAPTTIHFKMSQLSFLSKLYNDDIIKDGDVLLFNDIWFPGIESIPYMNYFCKKDVKIKGFLHAGSFTDTDFVRDMERWAKNLEDIIFDISDEIFVGSNFIKNDVIKKRFINPDKIIPTGLLMDFYELDKYKNNNKKENIIIFNGRNCDEKQPFLFDKLKQHLPEYMYVNTQKENLTKKEYYHLLSVSKCVVSFALQENFGYGIREAVYLGCVPVLPNRLVYPELYPDKYLYDSFYDCVDLVDMVMKDELLNDMKIENDNEKIMKRICYG